jgi:glycosyltransferase involved in cell wall biosynthesis/CDP-glycerol glycerophosphotransferase (TagB/SpsB family)
VEHQSGVPVRKRFGLVVAVYNVARYLPDFMASIEAQTHTLDDLAVVIVDDGSTDESLPLVEEWRSRRPELVTVLSQANAGQGAARNAGLAAIDCEWVSFPDPDDTLAADYLERVVAAIDRDERIVMVATNRIIRQDPTGELVNKHPLRSMFEPSDQVKNLDGFPEYFHGHAGAAFFRLELINDHALRFDVRIRPNFEDGHFCQRYLLRTETPVVAFLKSAVYEYRKRSDQSSTLQRAHLDPRRFTDVPRHGYLELLEEAVALRGHVPEWLQGMVIYELSYFISPEERNQTATACVGPVAEEFFELLVKIRSLLDEKVIKSFTARNLRARWRQILLYGLRAEPWHTPYVMLRRYDAVKAHVLVDYRFTGPEPRFQVFLRGREIQPVATKVRSYRYWDRVVMRERRAWLPADGTLRIRLGQDFVEMRNSTDDFVRTSFRPSRIRSLLNVRPLPAPLPRRSVQEWWRETADRFTRWLAQTRPVRWRFGKAWVLMDRVVNTGDNGLRLFEYLRETRPDLNAWFVLHRDSPDWPALSRRTNRLVAYGSWRWQLLMLNCHNLISSHVDPEIVRPKQILQRGRATPWKFVFLQHGVIKNDISNWLNRRHLDLLVTSSPAEHESIVEDGSSYMLTEKEVKMVGLARFDRLRRIGAEVAEAEQRTILVAPTWRDWLAPRLPGELHRRVVPDFADTDYGRNWLGILSSPKLADLCAREGLRIGFLPHPDMQSVLPTLDLPDHVDALAYEDHDVQRLFASAAVMVTDYSSTAFNSAYIDRPVVYFQFDKELMDAGAHLGTVGYFDYERDGFGPVAYTLEHAEEAVVASVLAGPRARSPYLERIEVAFPVRDGRCCERTVAAIEDLDRGKRKRRRK